ncbi:MAG: hypothetical protein LIP03_11480 [Bacteroidales bacterium]|nr:hypothetical protein [Bacteroidales bacterium]
MKIIIFNNGIEAVCDSAVGRDVMPLFVPDWGQWSIEGRIAFRIERLGKNVAEKFAMRYVDAYGAVAVLRPVEGTLPCAEGGAATLPCAEGGAATLPCAEAAQPHCLAPRRRGHTEGTMPGWWSIMDSAVTTGQWLVVPEGDIHAEWSLGDITESFTIGTDDWRQALVASIAEATRIATIKTGDIIIPPLPAFIAHPIPNQRLTALLSSTPSLRLKIK